MLSRKPVLYGPTAILQKKRHYRSRRACKRSLQVLIDEYSGVKSNAGRCEAADLGQALLVSYAAAALLCSSAVRRQPLLYTTAKP